MNVLILGSGGREHAFAWKIAKSSLCKKLLVAPGNAGTSELGTNVDIGVNDFEKIKELVLDEEIQMVVVGPEDLEPEVWAVAATRPDDYRATMLEILLRTH